MANRNEVAKLAGVSGATVSRVFNNLPVVDENTREKVLDAAAKLNYHPNSNARRLINQRTQTLAVIIPYIPKVRIFQKHYFAEILSGIAKASNDKGYDMLLQFYPISKNSEDSCLSIIHEKKADACLLMGTKIDDPFIYSLQKEKVPFVLINNTAGGMDVSFVDADHIRGAYEAVRHLLELGHRDICFVNGPQEYSNSIDREKGYRKALSSAGIEPTSKMIFTGRYSRTSGYELAGDILSVKSRPTAVFAANDRMAFGVFQGLRERNIQVPQDISLVGYDDSEVATYMDPPLTTVKVPLYETGYEAAAILIGILEGCIKAPVKRYLKTSLVFRKSTCKIDGKE